MRSASEILWLLPLAVLATRSYVLDPENQITELQVIDRVDVHPGDFGPAQDIMFDRIMELSK